jgi:hypothetical protein
MVGIGLYEIIALALALGGFGVSPNTKAPSADVVLEYAVEDADIVAYIDAVPLIPGNYTALKKLADEPAIKNSAELKEILNKASTEIETVRSTMKTMVGIDPVTDISNVTLFATLSTPPEILIVARGKFPTDMPTKIGKMMGGSPETIGDAQAIVLGAPLEMLAVSKSGVLFAGSRKLITARLDAKWKAPKRAKGSLLAAAAKILGDKPVYMAAASFTSGNIATMVKATAGPDDAAIVERFNLLAGAVYANGLGWVMEDKDADGHKRSIMASEGAIDLLRAAHLAPRGLVKIVLAFLDDVKSKDPGVAELKKHQDDILKLVDEFSGDGNFKVKWDKSGNRVAVRASGAKLSDVLPVGLIIPGLYLTLASASAKSAPATSGSATSTTKPVTPRSSGGITAPPKPTPRPPGKPKGSPSPKPANP